MTETVQISFDMRLWSGPKPSSFIVYAIDVGHLALAPEPIPEYERTALFKEKAKTTLENGHFAVEVPARVYEFYHLDESDYRLQRSSRRPSRSCPEYIRSRFV